MLMVKAHASFICHNQVLGKFGAAECGSVFPPFIDVPPLQQPRPPYGVTPPSFWPFDIERMADVEASISFNKTSEQWHRESRSAAAVKNASSIPIETDHKSTGILQVSFESQLALFPTQTFQKPMLIPFCMQQSSKSRADPTARMLPHIIDASLLNCVTSGASTSYSAVQEQIHEALEGNSSPRGGMHWDPSKAFQEQNATTDTSETLCKIWNATKRLHEELISKVNNDLPREIQILYP